MTPISYLVHIPTLDRYSALASKSFLFLLLRDTPSRHTLQRLSVCSVITPTGWAGESFTVQITRANYSPGLAGVGAGLYIVESWERVNASDVEALSA